MITQSTRLENETHLGLPVDGIDSVKLVGDTALSLIGGWRQGLNQQSFQMAKDGLGRTYESSLVISEDEVVRELS